MVYSLSVVGKTDCLSELRAAVSAALQRTIKPVGNAGGSRVRN